MPTPSRSWRLRAIGLCLLGACAAPAGAAPSDIGTCGDADFQARMLQRVNAFRAAAHGCGSRGRFAAAPALGWDDRLARAALAHTQEMAQADRLAHESRDGRSLADRANEAGYAWRALGENIASGQPGIDRVVDSWARSDGHCANMMSPRFKEVAVACVVQPASGRRYWTMDLGTPRR